MEILSSCLFVHIYIMTMLVERIGLLIIIIQLCFWILVIPVTLQWYLDHKWKRNQ